MAIPFLPQMIELSYCTCLFLVTRPFTWYPNFCLVTLTLKFDLLLKNFNLGCYLMMVAARRASLSSDNSYIIKARGYKTHNLFHKYRIKWKFISDSFYHMIIPKNINNSWKKYVFWENSARKWIFISYGIYETSCVFYIPVPLKKVCILRKFRAKIALKRRALRDVIMLLLMTSLAKERETAVKSVM